jgi:hypothetical protein
MDSSIKRLWIASSPSLALVDWLIKRVSFLINATRGTTSGSWSRREMEERERK